MIAQVTGAKKPVKPPAREPKGMFDDEMGDRDDFVEILTRLQQLVRGGS